MNRNVILKHKILDKYKEERSYLYQLQRKKGIQVIIVDKQEENRLKMTNHRNNLKKKPINWIQYNQIK